MVESVHRSPVTGSRYPQAQSKLFASDRLRKLAMATIDARLLKYMVCDPYLVLEESAKDDGKERESRLDDGRGESCSKCDNGCRLKSIERGACGPYLLACGGPCVGRIWRNRPGNGSASARASLHGHGQPAPRTVIGHFGSRRGLSAPIENGQVKSHSGHAETPTQPSPSPYTLGSLRPCSDRHKPSRKSLQLTPYPSIHNAPPDKPGMDRMKKSSNYDLADQVRDLGIAFPTTSGRLIPRPTAVCEFDGEKWVPIEPVNINYQAGKKAAPNDSAYVSDGSANTSPSESIRDVPATETYISDGDMRNSAAPSIGDYEDGEIVTAQTVRRSSLFVLPDFSFGQREAQQSATILEEEEEEEHEQGQDKEAEISRPISSHSIDEEEEEVDESMQLYEEPEANKEALTERRQSIQIMQQQRRNSTMNSATAPVQRERQPSVYASKTYQQKLFAFNDLAISEVDISEEEADLNLPLAKAQIVDAFPRQFEKRNGKDPMVLSVYGRSEETTEMLHIVLVLESRSVFWKNMGVTKKHLDKVVKTPYCWAADVDLPALSLDSPKVENQIVCKIAGKEQRSVIMCDSHYDECRKCKGLTSEDECFACDGTGTFKKRPCVMCSGKGQYFCTACKNAGHVPCKSCGSSDGPVKIERLAMLKVSRETVVSPTQQVETDNKADLISHARDLAQETIAQEEFPEGTLPVAACGIVIRNRGHVVLATDLETGSRGLFEVIDGVDRVTYKGQLAPVPVKAASIHSRAPSRAGSLRSFRSTKTSKATRDTATTPSQDKTQQPPRAPSQLQHQSPQYQQPVHQSSNLKSSSASIMSTASHDSDAASIRSTSSKKTKKSWFGSKSKSKLSEPDEPEIIRSNTPSKGRSFLGLGRR